MVPESSASATTERISTSVTTDGCSGPTPSRRNTSPVEASSSHTTGAAVRETSVMAGATRQAMPSGSRSAKRLGTSSPMTMDR